MNSTHPPVHSLTHSFSHSFLPLLSHSFIHSFVPRILSKQTTSFTTHTIHSFKMLTKRLVSTGLLATTALGIALPDLTPKSVSICAERGIDIHGPIPSDAIPFAGGYTFSADSNTSHWVRAQSHSLAKRNSADIAITMWTFPGCKGPGAYFPNVQYEHQNVAPTQYFYNTIETHRGLRSGERLDFSQRTPQKPDDLCYRYLFTAQREMPAKCLDVDTVSCFRLWHT